MKTHAAALCALSLLASAPAFAVPAQELDPTAEIRTSIRWLRSQQDQETGAYGGRVEPTALVLRALAECPDRYRPADGPFVRRALEHLQGRQRADGAICDEGAGESECERQTQLAVQALMALPGGEGEQTLAKALAWLGARDLAAGEWDTTPDVGTPEKARSVAEGLLAKREEDGFWVGPRGTVAETAQAVIVLSRAQATLARSRQAAKPAAEPVPLPPAAGADREAAREALLRGARFLLAAGEKGRWGGPEGPDAGITAMVLAALAAVPEPRPEEVQRALEQGLEWLVSLQHEDGSIHDGKLANYITSAAVLALARGGAERHRPVIERARGFLQGLQLDEGEGYSEGDLYYGGIGYGSTERPDLSNLQMALEALAASGLEEGNPTYVKALRFLERTQNRSESNDVRIVDGSLVIASGNDGGAGYAPGDSKAGFAELADGTRVPRSYGSMTYALLKCYLLAGLPKDDPRLLAAFEWCRKNFTLDVNPGFEASSDPRAAYQGLFYYYYTLARALDTYGAGAIEDAAGREHDWRAELTGRLLAMQSKVDGSWVNRNSPRWYEGNPLLATSYALLALDAAGEE